MSTALQPVVDREPPLQRVRSRLLGDSTPSTVAIGAITLATIVGIILTPSFVTSDNIKSILQDAALVGIVAVAMTPMAISGNFVSLGTQQFTVLAAMSFCYLVGTGMNVALAIVIVLAGLIVVGMMQGVIVAMGLNPVITTLAFGVITLGVINRINVDGSSASVGEHKVSWGGSEVIGIPIQVIVFIAVTAVVTVIMGKTAAGRRTALVGANRQTAVLTGISVTAVTVGVFVLASIGMAIAGVLGGAQFGVASTADFSTITISAVAAILVGGNSLVGGIGNPLRSAAGAVLISAISGLMTLNGFSTGWRQVVQGGLVVAVIVVLEIVRRNRGGR
jgi:ribose transport system permease protein